MQKTQYPALLFILIMLLCACSRQQKEEALQITTSVHESQSTTATAAAATEETQPVETLRETVPTIPLHTELYLPDYTTSQILEYFEEVVLNIEYSDGTGSANLVQKWLTPICYRIYGAPTDKDKEVLEALCTQLNAIPGFPGIYAAEDDFPENVSIHFVEPTVFRDSFSDVINGEDAFGAAQFWYYTMTNELYTARIGCRTDIDQATRDSVLVEEVINILGISDTILRTDSITYQYSNDNTVLSEIDLLIIALLYDPAIQCGMDLAGCSAVIQTLYY